MKKNLIVILIFGYFALSAFAQDSKVTVKLRADNLTSKAKESDLKSFFTRAGVEVISVQIIRKNVSGQVRIFGLVGVDVEQAENAVKLTNGKQFMGRALVVNIIAADKQKVEDAKNDSTSPATPAPSLEPTAVVSPSSVVAPSEPGPAAATPPTPAPEPTATVSPSPVINPIQNLVIQDSVANDNRQLNVQQTTIAPVKSAAALQADELIQKNIQSRGGREKFNAIHTIRMTGKMNMGMGMEAAVTMEMARPDKIRTELVLQGMTGVQTYDGKDGWALMPFLGKTAAEPVTGQQLEDIKMQANFDGMLIDYEAKGYQVELVGKEDLEGTPAYKLKITKKNGDISYLWLDAETYLEIKSSSKTNVSGQEIEGETMFGDYKESAGVLFAHSIQSKAVGMPGGMTLSIETVEINPSLTAARFAKP